MTSVTIVSINDQKLLLYSFLLIEFAYDHSTFR